MVLYYVHVEGPITESDLDELRESMINDDREYELLVTEQPLLGEDVETFREFHRSMGEVLESTSEEHD